MEAFTLLQDQSFEHMKVRVEIKSDTLLRSVSVNVNQDKVDNKLETFTQPRVISIEELKRDHVYTVKPKYV